MSTYNVAYSLFNAVNLKFDFGAKGDGVTDDTISLQSFISYCVNNNKSGFIPDGTYKVTAQLNFPCKPGWSIRGAHRGSVVIRQSTNNTPIFNLGSDSSSYMHSWLIEGITFDYANSQSGQNNSTCVLFSQMGY